MKNYNQIQSCVAAYWALEGCYPNTTDEKIGNACIQHAMKKGYITGFESPQKMMGAAWKAYKELQSHEEQQKAEAKGGAIWSVWS